ncbi:holo-ACP synthase [Streptomyces sp. NPDC059352]|uniref:holo-ACP synthase n=1 Tax=Streptomyces sp. NPDC059352 TaxID=3346810 RepID=UPI0036942783
MMIGPTGGDTAVAGELATIAEASASAAYGLVGRPVLCVGTDLVEVDEMRAVLARQPRFAARVFTPGERAYCDIPADGAERYAVRFAAKEAVLKALGVGLTGSVLTEAEVVRAPSGSPSLRLTGRAAALAEEAGVGSWLITLTHTRTLAHAFVAGLPAG